MTLKRLIYLSYVAMCMVLLLGSCIKEEAFTVDTAELSVNLTRAGTESTVQGDAITDAWIWAFQCSLNDTTGAPTIEDSAKAAGSRYVYGLNNYGNISVHVPLPTCNGEQDYLLVAIINTKTFSGMNLTAESTWGEIKRATFSAGADFWQRYPKDLAPEVMPVSNWTTFTIKSSNTHSDNKCYQLNLPVHRAVAKAQFLVNKSNENLDVDILDAKVVAKGGYSNGSVLTRNAEIAVGSNTEAIQRGTPDASAANWWWAVPTATTGVVYQMKNSDSGFNAVNDIASVASGASPKDQEYTWVASTFLFENNNDAPTPVGFDYSSQQGDGYNMYIKYQVNGETPVEVYTPLGKVVRNHDYTIKATVEQAVSGTLVINYIVTEWESTTIDVPDFN
jgi:hypothetical protein